MIAISPRQQAEGTWMLAGEGPGPVLLGDLQRIGPGHGTVIEGFYDLLSLVQQGVANADTWAQLLTYAAVLYAEGNLSRPVTSLENLCVVLGTEPPPPHSAGTAHAVGYVKALQTAADALFKIPVKDTDRLLLEYQFASAMALHDGAFEAGVNTEELKALATDYTQQAMACRREMSALTHQPMASVPHHATVARAVERETGLTVPLGPDGSARWTVAAIRRMPSSRLLDVWAKWHEAADFVKKADVWLMAAGPIGRIKFSAVTPWPYNGCGIHWVPTLDVPLGVARCLKARVVPEAVDETTSAFKRWGHYKQAALENAKVSPWRWISELYSIEA